MCMYGRGLRAAVSCFRVFFLAFFLASFLAAAVFGMVFQTVGRVSCCPVGFRRTLPVGCCLQVIDIIGLGRKEAASSGLAFGVSSSESA